MKIINSNRISKCGKDRIKQLLSSPMVNDYHKDLIKALEKKKPSNADVKMLNLISEQYGGNKC